MFSRAISSTILVLSIIGHAVGDKNATQDTKSKRGIQSFSNAGDYSILPVQHVGTFTQVRTLSPDETPLVDITYKSLESGYQNQHVPVPHEAPKLVSDNSYEAQSFYPQQLNYESLLQNPQQYFQPQALQQLPVYGSTIPIQQQYASNQLLGGSYPLNLNHKISSPIQQYNTQKAFSLPAGQLKRNNPLALNSYPVSTLTSLYGNTHDNPSLKLIQPSSSIQFNYPTQVHSAPQPIKYIQPLKAPFKPNNVPHSIQNQYHPAQLQQQQLPHSPLFQISQNFKSLEPKFFEPQVFNNPVVPQLQHFIPSSQNPFDKFTNPQQIKVIPNKFTPSPQIKPQQAQQNKDDSSDEEDDEDDDGVNRKVKEEIKGEIYHHEVNDEDNFNKGYRDSARGFPAYEEHDDDDEEAYVKPSYNHDDRQGRHENYKTSSRYSDGDHEDYRDVDSHREYTRRPHYDYDDERRSHYYADHDAEGDYSNKHQKKEPRTQSHSYRESYKYNKKGESDVHHKKPYKQYEKKYKSVKPAPYKPQSDTKYASNTVKGQSIKVPPRQYSRETTTAPKAGKQSTEPSYQYGFEPIKSPYAVNVKQAEDQEGRYSSNTPVVKSKIYRENWYLSKTKDA